MLHFFCKTSMKRGDQSCDKRCDKDVKRSMAFPGVFKVHKKRMPMFREIFRVEVRKLSSWLIATHTTGVLSLVCFV